MNNLICFHSYFFKVYLGLWFSFRILNPYALSEWLINWDFNAGPWDAGAHSTNAEMKRWEVLFDTLGRSKVAALRQWVDKIANQVFELFVVLSIFFLSLVNSFFNCLSCFDLIFPCIECACWPFCFVFCFLCSIFFGDWEVVGVTFLY